MRHQRYRENYWTKERVIQGMKRFYRDFGFAPTSTGAWQRHTTGTGENHSGVGNPYPSFYGVLKYWKTFRYAWKELGIPMNNRETRWSPEDERFLAQATGLLSRNQIATILDRTPEAVHRRMYDLGLNSRNAHGWTPHRVADVTGLSYHTVKKYADRGEVPYLRGTKCWYFDPADLLVISEIDWSNPPAELEEAVRRSLAARNGKPCTGSLVCLRPRTRIQFGDLVQVVESLPSLGHLKARIGIVRKVYQKRAGFVQVRFDQSRRQEALHHVLPVQAIAKVADGQR